MTNVIRVERQISEEHRAALGIDNWAVWGKEVSSFPWHYDSTETCLLLEGEVTVTPLGGEAVTIRAGDLASFPAGMACVWNVTQALRKYYRFG